MNTPNVNKSENKRRAARGKLLVDAYSKETGGGCLDELIPDAIADILHFAHMKNKYFPFSCTRMALRHFGAEVGLEAE